MSLSLGKNWRLTILRLILIGLGIVNIPIGVYTGLGFSNPSTLPPLQNDVMMVYERMLAAIYIPMGICAILAAFNPVRHRLLIIFIIVSSLAHASVMAYDALTTHLHLWPVLTTGPITLGATGIILLIFYPYGKVEAKEVE